ncbi:MAG: hypothetical protein R3B82_19740 [Sandaracinaceae bacterium]
MQARAVPWILAVALSGCIVPVDFDPVGEASSMQGSWTIASATPTAESCGEIAYVRVRFFRDEEHRDHHALVFECSAGGFDTRPERVVAEGAWTVALVAIRADGSVVEQGPLVEIDTRTEGGGHIVLPPFDITGGG